MNKRTSFLLGAFIILTLLLSIMPMSQPMIATASQASSPSPVGGQVSSEEANPEEAGTAFQRTKDLTSWKVDPCLIDNLTSPDYPFSEVRFIIICETEYAKAYVTLHLPSPVKIVNEYKYLPFIAASVPRGTDPTIIYRIAEMPGVRGIVADRIVRLTPLTAHDWLMAFMPDENGQPIVQQLPWPPKPSYFADYPWFLNETAELVGATEMWEMGYTGEGVVVAVIDTGIWKDHPTLKGKVIAEASFVTGIDWLPPEDANDYLGHGTACASIIAGTGEPGGAVWDLYYSDKIIGWVAPGTNVGMAPGAVLLNAKAFCSYGCAGRDAPRDIRRWSDIFGYIG